MSGVATEALSARLAALAEKRLTRTLAPPRGIDFSSNDYLGFASLPAFRASVLEKIKALPTFAAPSARLLRGHTEAHERLEAALATFAGQEAALLFANGYMANLALLSSVLTPRDRVLSDAQNHASLIDGMRLSGAARQIYPHLDESALAGALAQKHDGLTYVVTESLFSMDGDVAPLDRYAALCERHGAALIVDDAHAVGLYGERRSGLVEHFGVERRVFAKVSTFGKALGAFGACVSGSLVLKRFLVNAARPFIFTTALPPYAVVAIEAALELLPAESARGPRALRLAARLGERLAPLEAGRGGSPIVPLVLVDNARALAIAEALQARGFDVRAVRPPTVPEGTARLRLSVHADRTEAEIDALAAAIHQACAEAP